MSIQRLLMLSGGILGGHWFRLELAPVGSYVFSLRYHVDLSDHLCCHFFGSMSLINSILITYLVMGDIFPIVAIRNQLLHEVSRCSANIGIVPHGLVEVAILACVELSH